MRRCSENEAVRSSPVSYLSEAGAHQHPDQIGSIAFFSSNLFAIGGSQNSVADQILQWKKSQEDALSKWKFLLGRDGALTARDAQGAWWAGTSLPFRVGAALMESLELNCEVGCLLAPSTAALIRAALEKIAGHQAVIAVIPDEFHTLVALHCEDFSTAISAGRLWIAAGKNWTEELAGIFDANPGLCVPQQYIRTGLQDDAEVMAMIAAANPVFSAANSRRTAQLIAMRSSSHSSAHTGKIRVVAGSSFSLADLSGIALAETLCTGGGNWPRQDISRPTSASVLALAEAARDCDAMIAANLFRRDVAGAIPDELPFLTWATRNRIAAPLATSARDAVLVADSKWRKEAISAGWAPSRVFIAAWPNLAPLENPPAGYIALIADAQLSAVPERLKDFSSLGVLWEQIAAELKQNPLAVGDDVDAYLTDRVAQLDIDAPSVDRHLFKHKLILPAWRRGIALALHKAGASVAVYGNGWESAEFEPIWRGPLNELAELRRAAASASAIVHPEPGAGVNAVFSLGRPVVRAHTLLKHPNRITPIHSEGARLSENLILSILR
jgi:hypothetical protein